MKRPVFNRREQLVMIVAFFIQVICLLVMITVSIILMINWPDHKGQTPNTKAKQAHCDSIK